MRTDSGSLACWFDTGSLKGIGAAGLCPESTTASVVQTRLSAVSTTASSKTRPFSAQILKRPSSLGGHFQGLNAFASLGQEALSGTDCCIALRFRRHVGQALKFDSRQQPLFSRKSE